MGWEIPTTRAETLWGFFNDLAQQLYDTRLRKAERELKRHRPFLDR